MTRSLAPRTPRGGRRDAPISIFSTGRRWRTSAAGSEPRGSSGRLLHLLPVLYLLHVHEHRQAVLVAADVLRVRMRRAAADADRLGGLAVAHEQQVHELVVVL